MLGFAAESVGAAWDDFFVIWLPLNETKLEKLQAVVSVMAARPSGCIHRVGRQRSVPACLHGWLG